MTLIQYFVSISSITCVEILTKIFDVNSLNGREIYLIDEAVHNMHIECITLLIKSGSQVMKRNMFGLNSAHVAIGDNSPECLDILLKHTNEFNEFNDELLFFAILRNKPQCLKVLIDHGATINIKNDFWIYGITTPLILSVYKNHISCTKILLESGADIDMTGDLIMENTSGPEIKYLQCTALHIAIDCGYTDIINLLIEYEPDMSLNTYCISTQNDPNLQPIIVTKELNIS
jgi:ankyrin repeat protein